MDSKKPQLIYATHNSENSSMPSLLVTVVVVSALQIGVTSWRVQTAIATYFLLRRNSPNVNSIILHQSPLLMAVFIYPIVRTVLNLLLLTACMASLFRRRWGSSLLLIYAWTAPIFLAVYYFVTWEPKANMWAGVWDIEYVCIPICSLAFYVFIILATIRIRADLDNSDNS